MQKVTILQLKLSAYSRTDTLTAMNNTFRNSVDKDKAQKIMQTDSFP